MGETVPHRCVVISVTVDRGPTPDGQLEPEQPPVHVAAVPLLLFEAQPELLAESMYQFGTVQLVGVTGTLVAAESFGLTSVPTHLPAGQAAKAISFGVRGSAMSGADGADGWDRRSPRASAEVEAVPPSAAGVGAGREVEHAYAIIAIDRINRLTFMVDPFMFRRAPIVCRRIAKCPGRPAW